MSPVMLKKETITLHDKLSTHLQSARKNYIARNPESARLHEAAIEHLPGGNTRSVLHNDPFPISIKSGSGNRLTDVDGHEYLDLVSDMTAGVYGHSNPTIIRTLLSTLQTTGLNLGGTSPNELSFASAITRRIPSIHQLRFCNSGTEANLYALSIARHVTQRKKVVVFSGAYHGGLLTFALGIAANTVDREDWILARFNDAEGVRRVLRERKEEVAAVLVEGMQGAGGCIPGTAEFLHAVQEGARENGIIFILDEVMTFRLAPGGLQSKILHPQHGTPLTPDLTTLGKTIAGGIAIGAFGGREDLLSVYDPRTSSIQHSGTFNNNSLAMAVGCVALPEVYTPEVCIALNSLGDEFRGKLQYAVKGTKLRVTGLGAICMIHFLVDPEREIKTIEDVMVEQGSVEAGLKDLFCFYVLEKGYWLAQRGMISLPMGTTREELDGFLDIVKGFLDKYQEYIRP
ncbi:putative glutamate-1-semialdehyde 2,1-aminomutase [Lepidopterella palustris CBS 459.81]|uniref:Putative glutamate-1-semialdehyde 2,1-aminomutase n=1 Tax=Lepidopterella palustris CBS 459.81 TaxID=1314670 RepID=A0A8E2E0D1_9PEZI|nr:putative glutamate-1-semialdehyde 2,1-aminomutase [Lepidopterella palustris CBS 459.81]